MNRLLCLLAVLLLAAVLPAGQAQAQSQDPLAVFQAWETAFNAHDLDTAVGLFAPNGYYRDTHPAPGDAGLYSGPDQLRVLFAAEVAVQMHSQSAGITVSGDTVTVQDNRITVVDPTLPAGFPQPVESTLTVVVHNGKIQSMVLDNKPDWLARLQAVLAPLPGMPVVGRPAPSAPAGWLALAVLLVLLGAGVRYRRRRARMRVAPDGRP